MAMATMNNHEAFCPSAVPAALAAITVVPLYANAIAAFPALSAHSASVSIAAFGADVHASALTITLSAHVPAAFLRPAFVALYLAAGCCALIDGDPSLRRVLCEGRRCNC
jgi:hypothetical protein